MTLARQDAEYPVDAQLKAALTQPLNALREWAANRPELQALCTQYGELAQAGSRYSREGDTWEADANRPYRKVPTKRIAARAGVGAYYHIDGHTYKEETASKVVLPLKMNIGVPAEPVISDGAHVEKGQLIAACPEGKLGANLHASISGTAHLTGNAITITEV